MQLQLRFTSVGSSFGAARRQRTAPFFRAIENLRNDIKGENAFISDASPEHRRCPSTDK